MLDDLCWVSIQMFNILRLRALVSTKTTAKLLVGSPAENHFIIGFDPLIPFLQKHETLPLYGFKICDFH